jgi:hypothetical protein
MYTPLACFSLAGEKGRDSRCVRAGTIPEKAINLQAIFMIIYILYTSILHRDCNIQEEEGRRRRLITLTS